MIEWFEDGDAIKVVGHIGERGDSGDWETFQFEVLDTDGETHTVTVDKDDIPIEYGWNDFFDFLDGLGEEYDVDYENGYGETE